MFILASYVRTLKMDSSSIDSLAVAGFLIDILRGQIKPEEMKMPCLYSPHLYISL